jgi:hypothetical protein
MEMARRLIRRRPWRRRSVVTIDGDEHVLPPAAGVAVYETAGRVLLRPVDSCEGMRYERDEHSVVDGFPDVDPAALGGTIVELARSARDVSRPDPWPKLSEYAAPLLAAAPTRHRSYRSWQRATRHVAVRFDGGRGGGVVCDRWHPDLGNGSWGPADEAGDGQTRIDLGATTTSTELGVAVLRLLEEPPIAS